jgi:hypothetical protein
VDNWAFVLGHPGHELRAFHLAERAKPIVSVLTDGSGSTGQPRLAETTALLESIGARQGPVYGVFSDAAAYSHLMRGDAAPFVAVSDTLARHFVDAGISTVLVDAAEGYNPMHDVSHWIGREAAATAARTGRSIRVFEVDLVGPPNGQGEGLRLVLDDAAFQRKLDAVNRYGALAGEAASAFAEHGHAAFRTEFVREVAHAGIPDPSWIPHYERVGEERVRQGHYQTVLRYGAHVRPVLLALHATAIAV